jgi:arylsulfatase A-like enzyme
VKARGPAYAFRGVVGACALGAGLLAWRSGGGAEGPPLPPRPADLVSADGGTSASADGGRAERPRATGRDGDEVSVRLVEVAKDARLDARDAAYGQRVVGMHWRKMKPPFFASPPPGGPRASLVSVVGLRTSTSETQWAMPAGSGKQWAPDARIWNMNEGSFDQREALVAPPGSAWTFRVAVPNGADLRFSEGTLNATRDTTVFVVSVADGKGNAHELCRSRLAPTSARRWTDERCDLSAYAGQNVDLELRVETAVPTAEEKRVKKIDAPAPEHAPVDAGPVDGGALGDALGVPGNPVALWGNPTIFARGPTRVPYNVLWIVVDALRPDALASFHDDADDAAKLAAPSPPLEALLPKVPGLTPAIDDLATKGVRFLDAYSGGAWTRPGTLSMLAGMRSSELGIDTERWVLQEPERARYYASEPPLLPLLLRRQSVATHAFVNNYFMVGYSAVGVDMGFERVDDHRYRTRDTLEITRDATRWLEDNKDTRFFLFVNYNSPHEPYEPPKNLVDRVPPPPAGPVDKIIRLYMGEAAKDDEAIGVLVRTLDEIKALDHTIIVVTADHGETMSSAHAGTSALDKMPVRYHHAVSCFEETTRVPILIVAPGLLPANRAVKERVRNTDIAPTILELLGLEANPKMSGKSLAGLARGEKEKDERVVVSEGRGMRAIIAGKWRLLVREGAVRTTIKGDKPFTANEELYDLEADPGERVDLAPARPEIVAEMRARLDAALKNVPVAGTAAAIASGAPEPGKTPVLHLRFAGGNEPRRVMGTLTIGDAKNKAKSFTVEPAEIARDAFKIDGARVTLALTTSSTAAVGLDVVVDPPTTPVSWELFLDDKPWPDELVFGGPYGLVAPVLKKGIATDEGRTLAQAQAIPPIDARRDVGLFVVRERRGEVETAAPADDEGAEEMARLLREWGYAHATSGASK